MVLSGLSEVARQGDRFRAVFTVRNSSEKAVDTETTARLADGKGSSDLKAVTKSLPPGEAREIGWDVTVPAGIDKLWWDVTVKDKEGKNLDAIKVAQRVVPAVPVRVFQATLSQLDHTSSMPVEKPADALPGTGGVRLSLRPGLAGDAQGVVDYMSRYPFGCMEQKTSIAVALQDEALWRGIVKLLPSYMDKDGLVKYFPTMPEGDEILTAYVISVSNEAGWTLPETLLDNMKEGLGKVVEGKLLRRTPFVRPALPVRKRSALEALSRLGGATAAHLETIDIQPSLWPTSAVLDWTNILNRVKDVPDRDRRLAEAGRVIRSRLNFQGTTMSFSTEKGDHLWWLMTNGDVNSVRAVLAFMMEPGWKEDMPRLLKGAMGRQKRGKWSTTVANAWGRLALKRFSEVFEAAPVTGVTTARLGMQRHSLAWGGNPSGGTLMFGWPKGRSALDMAQEGTGRPWATVQSLAAIPLKQPFSSGFKITRHVTPVDRKKPGVWSVGDVVRVRLDLDAQADMTWVVVSDPVPAGASILGSGLGNDSAILTAGEKTAGGAWPAYEERSFEAFRAYYRYVPKGAWSVEYTMRLNTAGTFALPETRAEALYVPEMFGEIPNGPFEIE
jgi:uncharacterized protein YfaS (alpha-2-macroglobulin family)